ncbi:MAG: hypothetical protein HZC37_18785 [Burkholderiales bacterium]|nr:hypothetical protein [Burkholderiales bacterium]
MAHTANRLPARGCAARLPFNILLGPYELTVEFRPRSALADRRRLACVNLAEGRIELRQDLEGLPLARAFLDCIIRLVHFSKGCQQGCVEEAYTHSFATGMVEFAGRNPRAWRWFNLLLAQHLPGRAGYDRVVRGARARPPAMPRHLQIGRHQVRLRGISKSESGSAFGWYVFAGREVQLYRGLAGANLAVVALHEITHAVHHAHGLEDGHSHRDFRRAQARGWFAVMQRCPAAWRWLAWLMSFPEQANLATPAALAL